MRINLRAKIRGYTFFIMLAKTQSLVGITSKIVNDKYNRHYVFWDMEKCSLEQCKRALSMIQLEYDLSDIFITSDFPKSYRAWCFSKVDFKTLMKILLDTPYVDWNFIYWTMQKGKATLRLSGKSKRPLQKLVAVLPIKESNIPSIFEEVKYETGCDKIGIFKKFDFDRNIPEER